MTSPDISETLSSKSQNEAVSEERKVEEQGASNNDDSNFWILPAVAGVAALGIWAYKKFFVK